ncbi:hypothetical protein Chor_001535 [Crotalus horridus]
MQSCSLATLTRTVSCCCCFAGKATFAGALQEKPLLHRSRSWRKIAGWVPGTMPHNIPSMSSDFQHYSFRMPNIGFQNLPLNIYIVVFGTAIFVFILSLLFCCYLIRPYLFWKTQERQFESSSRNGCQLRGPQERAFFGDDPSLQSHLGDKDGLSPLERWKATEASLLGRSKT